MASTIRSRYLRLKNRQAKDWWTATFADPASWFILALVGDVRWITPNRITLISLLLKLVPAWLIAFHGTAHVLAAALMLQVGQVFDSMDGNLARYRETTSQIGGYLDRILDGAGYLVVMTAFSWHAFSTGSAPYYLLLGPAAAGCYLLVGYIYWNTAFIERKLTGDAPVRRVGGNARDISAVPLWRYILRAQKRIVKVNQADFYFWIGLFLILERPRVGLWFLFTANVFKLIYRFNVRMRRIAELEHGAP